jgi:hypothetical protein
MRGIPGPYRRRAGFYEVTHPGDQLPDPYCQAAPEPAGAAGEEDEHDHPRSDPGLVADAPTALTVFTAGVMHGSLLHVALNMLFLWIFGSRLERSIGLWRVIGLFHSSTSPSRSPATAATSRTLRRSAGCWPARRCPSGPGRDVTPSPPPEVM